MHILSGVHVSVVDHAAFWARPLPNIERKGCEDMSTIETTLRRRVSPVDFDKVATIPFRFVGELRHELRPTHVMNSLRQCVILDHVLDGKALHTDRLVFTDQASGEFLQEITARKRARC